MEFSAEAQRRSGVRVLRPWLGSARMVSLFYRIGLLAVSRPGTVETLELFVERMTTGRSIDVELRDNVDNRGAGRGHRIGETG